MIQLQMKFDSFGRMDSKNQENSILERERARQKSLQQRLEQLVAVHRQLLRKFATLELETGELKKKTQLRDERIRQLEGNSRSLIGNIRQQAEKHLAEVNTFREQIQAMKQEFEKQLELTRAQEAVDNERRTGGSRVVGGGGGVKTIRGEHAKSIRGGGVNNRSFYNPSSPAGAGDGSGFNYPSPTSAPPPSSPPPYSAGGAPPAYGSSPPAYGSYSGAPPAYGMPPPPNMPPPPSYPGPPEDDSSSMASAPRSMGLAARLMAQRK